MMTNPRSESVRSCRRQRSVVPCFPFGRLFGWVLLLMVSGMFVYRLSETGGRICQTACLWAAGISLFAGAAGLIPVYKVWGKDLFWVILGVFLSGATRLLIGFLGVVIIIFFTDIQRTRFVGYLALYYTALLAFDTWLALWVLRNTKIEEKDDEQETAVHGNLWDVIGRSGRPA